MVDLPAGPPNLGGSCVYMTAGCAGCYRGPIDQRPSVAKAQGYRLETLENRERYTKILIAELKSHESKGATVCRIHGGGDFVDSAHVRGWVRVVNALPAMTFFGTTRAWRAWHMDTPRSKAMRPALDLLRRRPNVALGASVDHATRSFVPWLKKQSPPWNIWNALTEFGDKGFREEVEIPVASGATKAANAEKQFIYAEEHGAAVGILCPQQTKALPDCAACKHCFKQGTKSRPRDVTFAYHT